MGGYFAEYDPDKANALLDEMGLKKGADGMRLRPDGKPLQVVLSWYLIGPMNADLPRLVTEYWTAMGVNTTPKQYESSAYGALMNSGEYDVGWLTMPGLTEYTRSRIPSKCCLPTVRPPSNGATGSARAARPGRNRPRT